MQEIGIYRRVFPLTSEAFIGEQARHMTRYRPTFIASTLKQNISFPHVSLSQADFCGIKQGVALLTRTPKLFQLNSLSRLGLIHAHFGIDGIYAMALAEKLKIPLLVTFHGYDATLLPTVAWRFGKLMYYQLVWHEAKLKQKSTAVIAVSQFIRQKLLKKGYADSKIIQHYIGVDIEKFTPGDTAEQRYILCVARHTEKKGIDTLLKAFAQVAHRHPQVSLLQVGRGSTTVALQSLAKSLGIENRVRFLGAQPHEEVLRLMQGAEIFALPSQTADSGDSEALGVVFNEASACAVPVVSTRHGGIPEAVRDGETGFLVPEKEPAALAEKLDILLSDRALGKQMGRRGRELVCEEFNIRKQTKKLEAIYDSLLAS